MFFLLFVLIMYKIQVVFHYPVFIIIIFHCPLNFFIFDFLFVFYIEV